MERNHGSAANAGELAYFPTPFTLATGVETPPACRLYCLASVEVQGFGQPRKPN